MTGSPDCRRTRRLVLASGNRHKLAEAARILAPFGVEVVPAAALGAMPDVAEDGATFEDNALQKARAVRERLRTVTLADDSGLEVEGLDGEPGTRSARYAGPGATDADNNRKLLSELARRVIGGDPAGRRARFVCVLALLNDKGEAEIFRGECPGRIAAAPAGREGFGYDPLFVPDGHGRTFGEMGAEVKDRISHRARALAAMTAFLRTRREWIGTEGGRGTGEQDGQDR